MGPVERCILRAGDGVVYCSTHGAWTDAAAHGHMIANLAKASGDAGKFYADRLASDLDEVSLRSLGNTIEAEAMVWPQAEGRVED